MTEASPRPETELDDALEMARKDPGHPNDFYDLFLNSDVFFPVQIAGKAEPSWQKVGPKDRFHPCRPFAL